MKNLLQAPLHVIIITHYIRWAVFTRKWITYSHSSLVYEVNSTSTNSRMLFTLYEKKSHCWNPNANKQVWKCIHVFCVPTRGKKKRYEKMKATHLPPSAGQRAPSTRPRRCCWRPSRARCTSSWSAARRRCRLSPFRSTLPVLGWGWEGVAHFPQQWRGKTVVGGRISRRK